MSYLHIEFIHSQLVFFFGSKTWALFTLNFVVEASVIHTYSKTPQKSTEMMLEHTIASFFMLSLACVHELILMTLIILAFLPGCLSLVLE